MREEKNGAAMMTEVSVREAGQAHFTKCIVTIATTLPSYQPNAITMASSKKSTLADFKINIKIKLAALWTATTLCYLYGDYFELYTPGKIDSLISGENVLNSPLSLLIASVLMALPPLMIFLSVFLKPALNRWLNVIVGLIFTLIMVLIAIGSLVPWYSFYVFLAIVEATLTTIIVWSAIKWPKTSE